MLTYLTEAAERIRSSVADPGLIPDDADHLFLLYAVLLRAKGRDVTSSDVHDAWSAWMQIGGKSHQSIVPFSDLDAGAQREDLPFVEAIHRVAEAESGSI